MGRWLILGSTALRPYVKLHIRPIMHSPRLCEVKVGIRTKRWLLVTCANSDLHIITASSGRRLASLATFSRLTCIWHGTVRSSVGHNSLLKWGCHVRLPQKLCPAYICIKPCLAAYILHLSTIRSQTSHDRELCIIGLSSRSPVIWFRLLWMSAFIEHRESQIKYPAQRHSP